MQDFNYNFGDRYIPVQNIELCFRIYTDENVYTPDPEHLTVTKTDQGLLVTSNYYASAGLQCIRDGRFEARIVFAENDEIQCQINAQLDARIKGTAMRVRYIPKGDLPLKYYRFKPYEEVISKVTPQDFHYPEPLFHPGFIMRYPGPNYFYVMSDDVEVREKLFEIHDHEHGVILDCHHYESAGKWARNQETPIWRIGNTNDAAQIFSPRIQSLEKQWGLAPWESRADVPDWARQVGLVVNLHGMHWAGYIYNDYQQQLNCLKALANLIDGKHILAYLAAWDGRYNYNWPNYNACERMGGRAGLKALVLGAHDLGIHVIPQIGAVSANRKYLPQSLHDCASQDAYGNTFVASVDWDGDRMADSYRVNANIGHPAFQQFLLDQACRITEQYGFDGMYLDITQSFHNDPRCHIAEGHKSFCKDLKAQFSDYLLWAEELYDALMGAYPLCSSYSGNFGAFTEYFEKYNRVTYHLIHPAPSGSTGVYEAGFLDPVIAEPDQDIIPCLTVVDDTMSDYREEVMATIDAAKVYMHRKGIRD